MRKRQLDILKNANLTPYETRELVREYLEANVTSFKIGFFGKQKTLQERERRRQNLLEDVKKQTDSNHHLAFAGMVS